MITGAFDANPASAIARHTVYSKLYGHAARTRDAIMPTMLGLGFYPKTGSVPHGFRMYNNPPVIAVNYGYGGRIAIADLRPIERPLPWERIVK